MDDYKVIFASMFGLLQNVIDWSQPIFSCAISVMTIVYLGKKIKAAKPNKEKEDV